MPTNIKACLAWYVDRHPTNENTLVFLARQSGAEDRFYTLVAEFQSNAAIHQILKAGIGSAWSLSGSDIPAPGNSSGIYVTFATQGKQRDISHSDIAFTQNSLAVNPKSGALTRMYAAQNPKYRLVLKCIYNIIKKTGNRLIKNEAIEDAVRVAQDADERMSGKNALEIRDGLVKAGWVSRIPKAKRGGTATRGNISEYMIDEDVKKILEN